MPNKIAVPDFSAHISGETKPDDAASDTFKKWAEHELRAKTILGDTQKIELSTKEYNDTIKQIMAPYQHTRTYQLTQASADLARGQPILAQAKLNEKGMANQTESKM